MIKDLIVFTDLDGTLLDKNTFHPGPALASLEKCRKLNIPVVFVSAKSRAEIEPIRKELANNSPFIIENGGALYLPVADYAKPEGFEGKGSYWRWCSGESIENLRRALNESAARAGVKVESFDQMSAGKVAELTGLSLKQAKLAKMREYDEPFIVIDQTPEKLKALVDEINKCGYRYSTGGYLHHIMGDFDKGRMVELLKKIYLERNPDIKFAGLGDAGNDLPMLKLVDYPFLVRKPDNSFDSNLVFDGLTVTQGIGPAGFAEAIDHLIEKFRGEQ